MKLLVIDTATEACSVALLSDGQVFNRFELCPQQHSQRLLPMVDEVLKEAGMAVADLDYLGFGQGPGSFTGVRIATGMLQGLALGADLPVVGVSTLAAMAQQSVETQGSDQVVVAIDARMDEVYWGCYRNEQGLVKLVGEEQVLPPEQAVGQLTLSSYHTAGTGWAAYAPLSELQTVTDDPVLYPNAKYMLPLAVQAINDGLAVEVEAVQPVYLRDKVTWKKLPGR